MGYGLLFYSLIGLSFLFFSACQNGDKNDEIRQELSEEHFTTPENRGNSVPYDDEPRIAKLPLNTFRLDKDLLYRMADSLVHLNITTQERYNDLYERHHRLHVEDWLICEAYYIEIALRESDQKNPGYEDQYEYIKSLPEHPMITVYRKVIERSGTSWLKADSKIKKEVANEQIKILEERKKNSEIGGINIDSDCGFEETCVLFSETLRNDVGIYNCSYSSLAANCCQPWADNNVGTPCPPAGTVTTMVGMESSKI